jgi:hypothetical protein
MRILKTSTGLREATTKADQPLFVKGSDSGMMASGSRFQTEKGQPTNGISEGKRPEQMERLCERELPRNPRFGVSDMDRKTAKSAQSPSRDNHSRNGLRRCYAS